MRWKAARTSASPVTPCSSQLATCWLEMRNVGKSDKYGDLDNIFNRPFSGGLVVFGRSTAVPVAGDAWENSITGVTVSRVTVRNDPGRKHLFSGSWDKSIKLWDTATGKSIDTFTHHNASVNALAISAPGDNRFVASCGYDYTVRILPIDLVDVDELFGDIKHAAS